MIADADLIAAGLFLLPLAMFSRRPIGTQNRGRVGAPVPATGAPSTNYLLDGSGNILIDDSGNRLTNA